ncbi:MAG: putative transrane anti-sigma factor [Pedosphaera sp.]|nr:putative transrane anti-sigma factor [Pedosphaera sp.]
MINHDSQLKLQAYLDGELSAKETAEVQNWIATDQDAQLLLAELQNTNAALVGFEAEIKLPETREFFWSKIQREIESQEKASARVSARPFSLGAWLQRHLVPVSGTAMAILVLLLVVQVAPSKNQVGEMELSSGDVGAVTFRNESEKMTLVWFYDKADSGFTESDSLASLDQE